MECVRKDMGPDDSEIPTCEVVQHVATKKTTKNRKIKEIEGDAAVGLGSSGVAEDADAELDAEIPAPENDVGTAEPTGKRKRRPNARYANLWRHANCKGEDLVVPGLK
ncbi:hypothetical protein B0H13DRAFT_2303561 [Mycena leptocephala]|nr:hypothetical protein B0H13DRAFT_2303561 [Mycena leptocephala]